MTLWSFMPLRSCYRFICTSTLSTQKAPVLYTAPLGSQTQRCSIFLQWRRATSPRSHAQIFNRDQGKPAGWIWNPIPFFPKPHCISTPARGSLASHVHDSHSKLSPRILKRHTDQEKVHVCSSGQESSSYVLQLGLKKNKKGKMKNRSLNSRLAVMFLMNREECLMPKSWQRALNLGLLFQALIGN